MKNIEFRIYDKQEKKFLIKGEEVKRGDIKNLLCEIIDFDDFSIQIDNPDNDRYQFLQCTGITDKNGVKIFEGDIVIIKNDYNNRQLNKKIIRWLEGSFGVKGLYMFIQLIEIINDEHLSIEVIGNIYENPELLKK